MRLFGLKRRPRELTEEELPPPEPLQPLPPVLNLLVPDVAGVTSFRLKQFFDIEEAREYVEALPSASGLHAFWGLHGEPVRTSTEAEGSGEAMVLIRAQDHPDTVYVVSFVDIESALAFVRFEVKRGTDLGQIAVYWAELVAIVRTEDGIRFIPEAPPAITAGAVMPIPVSPGLERARLRQEQEKNRLQAEIEEIRERQAHTEEVHRRQAQVDDKRKQLELVEMRRRQTKTEDQRRLQAEANEIEKLRAEAEELRRRQAEAEEHERREAQARRLRAEEERVARLRAQAEEEERLRAELEEIERRQAEAEARERYEAAERAQRAEDERKRRLAEAEEMRVLQVEAEELAHQLTGQLYLLAQEQKGRLNAERQARPGLRADAELTRRLQTELQEIKHKQAEAEARWHQDAVQRSLKVEAEESKRREEAAEKRRLEAEQAKRLHDELAEVRRQQAEAITNLHRTEEDELRLRAEAERAGRLEADLHEMRRQQIEAQERWHQEAEERRLRLEAEERERREAEDSKRRQEAEETRMIQAQLENIRRRLSETHAMPSDLDADSSPEEMAQDSPLPAPAGDETTAWAPAIPQLEGQPEHAVEPEPALEPVFEFSPREQAGGEGAREEVASQFEIERRIDGVEQAPSLPDQVDAAMPEPVAEGDTFDAVHAIDIEREALAFLKAEAAKADGAWAPEVAPEAAGGSAEDGVVTPPPFFLPGGERRQRQDQEAEVAAEFPTNGADAEHRIPAFEPQPVAAGEPETASAHAGDELENAELEPRQDVVEEVEKILKVKRWDKRDSPFRGFDSPPGRF